MFPKIRLAVRQVGEMARRGAPVNAIIEDYPYLHEQDVEFAKLFVGAYPRVGVRVSVKLLLDENLSPAAVIALVADGIDAYHVRDRGILGATDHELLDRAYREDRVLVTSNVDDFDKLARAREIHAGIVLIERAGLLRSEQIELVGKIAEAIREHGSMINELLRVAEDNSMTFETSHAPPRGTPKTGQSWTPENRPV